MKKAIKINKAIMALSKKISILLFLAGVFLITSCGVLNNRNDSAIQPTTPSSSAPMEVILFCGNPGVGKSSLCNSIFQQEVFESGISVGQGMTQEKQEYTYQNRKYIDTPGLSDINLRKQAAEEIEEALKENNNYKIIFVATLEAGRIKEADLVTINTVCDAIKTTFDYGIIFNKVTNGVIREIGENGENLKKYLTTLIKQPLLTVIIKKDGDMEDTRNVYLHSDSDNRRKMINFIANLPPNRIEEKRIEAIDVRAYDKKVEEMELKLMEALKKAEEERKQQQNLIEQQIDRAEYDRIAYKRLIEQQRIDQQKKDEEYRRLIEQQRIDQQEKDEEYRRLIEQQRINQQRLEKESKYYVLWHRRGHMKGEAFQSLSGADIFYNTISNRSPKVIYNKNLGFYKLYAYDKEWMLNKCQGYIQSKGL